MPHYLSDRTPPPARVAAGLLACLALVLPLALSTLPEGASRAAADASLVEEDAVVSERSGAESESAAIVAELTSSVLAGRRPHAATSSAALDPNHPMSVTLVLRPAASPLAVERFAQANGLVVVDRSPLHLSLSGPGSELASLLGTTLAPVDAMPGSPTQVLAATSPLLLPAELRTSVEFVAGLDERPRQRPHAVPYGYTGAHLRSAYGAPRPASSATPLPGSGTTVGLIQFSGWERADLTTYAAAAGVSLRSGQITEIALNGASVNTLDPYGGSFEVALDTQAVLAVAPGANQRVYFTTNDLAGSIAAYARMAADAEAGRLTTVASSWGVCEPLISNEVISREAPLIRRIVAAGATFTASTGDSGGYDCSAPGAPDPRISVDFPASLPEVLAVGGTSLPADAARNPLPGSERAWGTDANSDPARFYQGDGSGGGHSAKFPRPAYQARLGLPGSARMLPDVSALADPSSGMGVYVRHAGGWLLGGGTSLSSPVWAALIADAAAARGSARGPGMIHNTLYTHPELFYDVTAGRNNVYAATPGYDLVTGLGAPRISRLAPLLSFQLPSTPPPTTAPSPTPTRPPTPTPTPPRPTPPPTLPPASPTPPPPPAVQPTPFPQLPPPPLSPSRGNFLVGTPGLLHPLQPARVLDSRTGLGGIRGALSPNTVYSFPVTGRGGVPNGGAASVVLNLTVTGSSEPGALVVRPSGSTQTRAPVLYYAGRETVPILTTVPVGPNGHVVLELVGGATHVVADVTGYYTSASREIEPGAGFHSLTPQRVYDSRSLRRALAPGELRRVQINGRGGVPTSGVRAVLLNTTVTGSTGPGHLVAFPSGASSSVFESSNLNYLTGQTAANLVLVPVASDGTITVRAASGSPHVVIDVEGYFAPRAPGDLFRALPASRLADTREDRFEEWSNPVGRLPAGSATGFTVAGRAGVPLNATAVMLTVAATGPDAPGFIAVYPAGQANPGTSVLNLAAGQTRANSVVVPVGRDGKVSIYSSSGRPYVLLDVVGYYMPAATMPNFNAT